MAVAAANGPILSTSPVDYSQHFWGEKHIGYHVLYENLKRGEDTVSEFSAFLKERIGAEDEAQKQLQKSVNRINNFVHSNGPFVEAWRLTKSATEVWSQIQTTLLKQLVELSKEAVKYHDDLVKSRKRVKEDDVLDAVNLMQTTTTCLQKAKETYQQRCAEAMALMRSEGGVSGSKEFTRLKQKLVKAHEEYKAYVEKYNQVRDTFEEKILKTAHSFQAHDIAHLEQMRRFFNQLVFGLNERSQGVAQVMADYHRSLAAMNIVEDAMRKFIAEKATGQERPHPIKWTEADEIPLELQDPAPPLLVGASSAASSSNSSAIVPGSANPNNSCAIVNDLLGSDWDQGASWLPSTSADRGQPHKSQRVGQRRVVSEGRGDSSDDESGTELGEGEASGDVVSTSSNYVPQQFSSWLGRQKITQWRKKHHSSHTNLSVSVNNGGGGGGEGAAGFSTSFNEPGGVMAGLAGRNQQQQQQQQQQPQQQGGGNSSSFLKRYKKRSKNSLNDVRNSESATSGSAPVQRDLLSLGGDNRSTTSSSKSDERGESTSLALGLVANWFSTSHSSSDRHSGSVHQPPPPLPATEPPSLMDETPTAAAPAPPHLLLCDQTSNLDTEGYSLKPGMGMKERSLEGKSWPGRGSGACSSSSATSDDEEELKASRIKGLQIKPLNDSEPRIDASVDELRSAMGSISLSRGAGRASISDPWSTVTATVGMNQHSWSRSGGGSSNPFANTPSWGQPPMRAALTGDEHLRRRMPPTDSSVFPSPSDFSQSMQAGSIIARARPRSHTPLVVPMGTATADSPKLNSFTASFSTLTFSDSFIGQQPSSSSPLTVQQHQQQSGSGGGTGGRRVPLALACNEYFHAWFKPSQSRPVTRVFGTVLISLPVSAASQLKEEGAPLKLRMRNASAIKSVLPNKKLLCTMADEISKPSGSENYTISIERHKLVEWLAEQQRSRPESTFHNVDILRYELRDGETCEAPLLLNSYWKAEGAEQVDMRCDYRLNMNCELHNALLNVTFATPVGMAQVASLQSQPDSAKLEEGKLQWTLTELSKHGEAHGSLKARVKVDGGGNGMEPANTTVQFQILDSSISGMSAVLESETDYQLTMVRRKVIAGKYFYIQPYTSRIFYSL